MSCIRLSGELLLVFSRDAEDDISADGCCDGRLIPSMEERGMTNDSTVARMAMIVAVILTPDASIIQSMVASLARQLREDMYNADAGVATVLERDKTIFGKQR